MRFPIHLLCAMLLMPLSLMAKDPGESAETIESTWDGTEQPYNLFIPSAIKEKEKLPLVVVLHGKGATWESWFAATSVVGWAEEHGYVVASPHGRGDWFYLGPGEQDVLDVIEEVKEELPIDGSRIYLAGHSMGGWGTWHLGAAHPDLFAAIVPMSGWAPTELLPNLEYTPPFVIHGDADDIVDPENSREAVAELGRLGIDHRFAETRGYGHESSMINDMLPAIAHWLEQHQRPASPDTVSITAFTPKRGKAWWLKIEALEEPFTAGTLLGEKVSSGELRLETTNIAEFVVHPSQLAEKSPPTGQLSLQIDESKVAAEIQEPSAPLRFRKVGGEWQTAQDPLKEEPVITLETIPGDLPQWTADMLLAALPADSVALSRDLVAPGMRSREVFKDDILDLFLRQEDQIMVFEMTPDQYEEFLGGPDYLPRWWGDLAVAEQTVPDGQARRVAVPAALGELVPLEGKALSTTLRTALYKHLMSLSQAP